MNSNSAHLDIYFCASHGGTRSITVNSMPEESDHRQRVYYRGVYACGKRWKAQIHYESSQHYLGTFDSPEEAAKAYDRAARIHHGYRARVNFDNDDGSYSGAEMDIARAPSYVSDSQSHESSDEAILGRPAASHINSEYSLYVERLLDNPARLNDYLLDLKYRMFQAQNACQALGPEAYGSSLMDEYVALAIRVDDVQQRMARRAYAIAQRAERYVPSPSSIQPNPSPSFGRPFNSHQFPTTLNLA